MMSMFTYFISNLAYRNIRCNVEFDHAVKVRFSPDSKYIIYIIIVLLTNALVYIVCQFQLQRSFIAGLGISNTIRAFKIVKKDDTNMHMMQAAVADFPQVIKINTFY